jgi:hypothetical protein
MLNSKPNNPGKYDQGNYVPKYKDKVVKLNNQGGVYYRSSWEKKIMTWLDHNKNIIKWGAECMRIPYQITSVVDGDMKIKSHSYFPDFYYEMRLNDSSIKHVVVEVKPKKDYEDAILFENGKFNISENLTLKKLKNLEYRFKTAQKNSEKWKTMIAWCNKKGYEFIIITEDHLKKFSL